MGSNYEERQSGHSAATVSGTSWSDLVKFNTHGRKTCNLFVGADKIHTIEAYATDELISAITAADMAAKYSLVTAVSGYGANPYSFKTLGAKFIYVQVYNTEAGDMTLSSGARMTED